MSYADVVAEHRRLAILRELVEAAQYTSDEYVLAGRLEAGGKPVGRDRLRADLAWLEEQSLAITQQPGGIWVATLTALGEDVAAGRSRVPGVARPRPEA